MASLINMRCYIIREGTAFNCLCSPYKQVLRCKALNIPCTEEELCVRVVLVPKDQKEDKNYSYTDHGYTSDIQEVLPEWASKYAPAFLPVNWLNQFAEGDVVKLPDLPIRIHFDQGKGQVPTHRRLMELIEDTKNDAIMHLEWKIKDLQKQIENIHSFELK